MIQEARQGIVDLSAKDPKTLDRAINCLYATATFGWHHEQLLAQSHEVRYSQLYALAKRLDLSSVAHLSAV